MESTQIHPSINQEIIHNTIKEIRLFASFQIDNPPFNIAKEWFVVVNVCDKCPSKFNESLEDLITTWHQNKAKILQENEVIFEAKEKDVNHQLTIKVNKKRKNYFLYEWLFNAVISGEKKKTSSRIKWVKGSEKVIYEDVEVIRASLKSVVNAKK